MGQPFKGMGLEAFDNAKKEGLSVWVDNMSTGVVIARGHMQADGQTIVYRGSRTDSLTGGDVEIRIVWQHVDDKRWFFEMYDRTSGRENKILEMTATRP